jgi:hypothetical protein
LKRYRVFNIDFDARARVLGIEIEESWNEETKAQWRKNKEQIKENLLLEFGSKDGEAKIKNFCDLGAAPVSIVAFHNKFLRQIRYSFVIGSYYPALTGTCSLGERILNQLIIKLRSEFKNTPGYKQVYRNKSFDDWQLAIEVLSSWDVFRPNVAENINKLAEIRNKKAIHFNPETDRNDREIAFGAIRLLSEIIQDQFGALGVQPWFIENTKGSFYIKKAYENDAFIKNIYLPNCVLVGPYHRLEYKEGNWTVIDDYCYEPREISDKEFVELLDQHRATKRH